MKLFATSTLDAPAVDDGRVSRSFAELESRLARFGGLLRGPLGLAPGAHVALLAGNSTAAFEVVLAAMVHGVWITPVNWHLADEEVAYVLDDCGARALFVDEAMASRVPAGFAGEVFLLGAALDARLASVEPRAPLAEDPPGGTMIYTSGTSGRPKGVQRARPPTLAAALDAWRTGGRAFGFDGRGPHLVTGPLYHAAPLLFAVYDLLNGATVLLMPRWDERAFLRLVREREVRHTHLVPTMMVRLLRLPEDERAAFDPSGLTLVMHGAAPITPETKQAMIAWWGPRLVEYWGATEGGIYTLIHSEQWLAHPGSVGRAIGSFEIEAVDEHGATLPRGEEGTLVCRHRTLARPFVYFRDAAKTEASYLGEGRFTVGDLGWVDAEGFVHLGERRSNLILSGGVNIYPAEIERVLASHPAVADVAVFGIPDAEWGEQVRAAVQLREGELATPALEAELLAYARTRLAGFKVPRAVDFHLELPRTEAGKMMVRTLRAPFVAGG